MIDEGEVNLCCFYSYKTRRNTQRMVKVTDIFQGQPKYKQSIQTTGLLSS